MHRGALSFMLAILASGCATSSPPGPIARPELSIGDAVLHVEMASTPDARARGLMGRIELPSDQGMAFVFDGPTTSQFWMKDTLIPLSIAFWGKSGRILRILDMTPCRRDLCKLYDPQVAFRGALEVNRDAFARWGVRRGALVTIRR